MSKRLLSIALSVFLLLSMAVTAMAASDDQATAVHYVVKQDIFVGDSNGSLNAEDGLTRAELAALLTRINGDDQDVQSNEAQYAAYCKFTDVPGWAKPYVGYCVNKGLMVGYSDTTFGAGDPVNPQAACTVMLRYLGHAETDWSYSTSVVKAHAVGIAASSGLDGATITRGTMAVLIYKSQVPGGKSGSVTAETNEWMFQLNAAPAPLQSYTIEGEIYVRLWQMCRWLDVYVGMEQSAVVIDLEKPHENKKVYYESTKAGIAIPSTHTVRVNDDASPLATYLVNDEIYLAVDDIATWKGVLAYPDSKYSNSYVIDTGKRMVVDNSDIATRDADRAEVIRLVNEERVRVGVAPLEVLPSLMECAQIKAEDMFVNEYYSHTSPTYGAHNVMISQFVPEAIGACSENIAMTRPTPQRVFEAWLNSPGHYANMIDPQWTHTGVGAAKLEDYGYLYWAQQFVALK